MRSLKPGSCAMTRRSRETGTSRTRPAETGEVTRYLGTYGRRRVCAAALLAPLPPYLPGPAVNPDGAGQGTLDDFCAELAADRPAAVKAYLDRYYNIDVLGGTRVTDQAWQNSFHVAIGVSSAALMPTVGPSDSTVAALLTRMSTRPACAAQPERDGPADAAPGPGDQRGLAS